MNHKQHSVHSAYLEFGLDSTALLDTADACLRVLTPLYERGEFDALAFCGMSGAIITPMLAAMLGCGLIMVRKGFEKGAFCKPDSHSFDFVEGAEDAEAYIIVDDFISSGRTARYIVGTINDQLYWSRPVCRGLLEARALHRAQVNGITPASEFLPVAESLADALDAMDITWPEVA